MADRRETMAKIDEFVKHLKERDDARLRRHFPDSFGILENRFYVDKGARKYARIVSESTRGTNRSVFLFVEIATGNILKAASWKAPAKHARGNIFESFDKGVGDFGAAYIR